MQKSRILEWVERASVLLSRGAERSMAARWIVSLCTGIREGFARGYLSKLGDEDRFLGRLARGSGRQGLAATFQSRLGRLLLESCVGSWGCFFVIYGGVSLPVQIFFAGGRGAFPALILPLSLLGAALPCLQSTRALSSLLRKSFIGRTFLIRFCGIFEEELSGGEGASHLFLASLFGVLFGVASIFLPYALPILLLSLILTCLFLRVPELLLLLLSLALPFLGWLPHPTLTLTVGAVALEIAWLRKYRRGQRILFFGCAELLILLLGLLYLLGGLIGEGGWQGVWSGVCRMLLILLFFPSASLLLRKQWRRRVIGALHFSAAILSTLGIFQYFFTDMELKWVDLNRFCGIAGRVGLSFGNPNILSAFLVLILPLGVSEVFAERERGGRRLLFCAACVAELLCLVLTWSRGAWLGLLIALPILLLLCNKSSRSFLILAAVPAILFSPALPKTVISRFFSIGNSADSSIRYRFYTWKGVARMLRANPWGIGTGETAFRNVYPSYAVSGTETVMHAHRLLLQVTTELGFPGGAVLLLLLLLTGLQVLYGTVRLGGHARGELLGASCGILGFLVMGCFDYVWYHFGVFALFWILLALAFSALAGEEQGERRGL